MDGERLAEYFECDRARLHAVAYRLLGSASEADDAVQETWLRLSRSDTSDIENLSGWLTTVVGRICLDMLRSRTRRREEPLSPTSEHVPDTVNPEIEALQAESVGFAMEAVMERLSPPERVAFVLHDAFAVPYEEIAGIIDRSPEAARQAASRGRRRVRGASEDHGVKDEASHRHIVEAFFSASRAGDFQALLALLDPDVVLRADAVALRMGARTGWLESELEGAEAVAKQFDGQAQAAQPALIDGTPGAIWAPGGKPFVAFELAIRNGRVAEIHLTANPERLRQLRIEVGL